MAAQVGLDLGREPAQRPVGVGAVGQRMRERGLREVHLRGDLLHPGLVGPGVGVEQADGGGVAGEGPVGEGVDDPDPHGPTARPAAWREPQSGGCVGLRRQGQRDVDLGRGGTARCARPPRACTRATPATPSTPPSGAGERDAQALDAPVTMATRSSRRKRSRMGSWGGCWRRQSSGPIRWRPSASLAGGSWPAAESRCGNWPPSSG